MTLYAYRLAVKAWPGDGGQQWNRYYGDGAPAPYDEIPPWLLDLATSAIGHQYEYHRPRSPLGRVADRLKIDDADEVIGVLMPKVNRRHYLSASGAHELARDMRAFGAVVVVQRSDAITEWTGVDGAAGGPSHV